MTTNMPVAKVPTESEMEYIVEIREMVAIGGFPEELAHYFIARRMSGATVRRLLLAAIKTIQ